MAVPSSFNTIWGFPLMRQNVGTGEWFFVDWVNGDFDHFTDAPGAGTWRYEVWAMVGYSTAEGITTVGYGDVPGTGVSGRADLTVQSLKR